MNIFKNTIKKETATSGTGTVDTAHDDVATGDLIRIDCDTLSTTKPHGLIISLAFRLP